MPIDPMPLTSPTLDAASAAVGACPAPPLAGQVIGHVRIVGGTRLLKLSLQLSVPLAALVWGAHAMLICPLGAAKSRLTVEKALAGNAGDDGVTAQPEIVTVVEGAKFAPVVAILPLPVEDRMGAVPVGGR